MKKTIIALSFMTIIAFLSACDDKTTEKPTDTIQDMLKGEWVWIKTEGGFAGITQTPNDYGLVRVFNFADKTLTVSENNSTIFGTTLLGSAILTFTNKKSLLTGQNADFMLLNTTNCNKCKLAAEYDVALKGKDTLLIQEDANDGFLETYVRKTEGYKLATYLGIDPKLCPTPCCGGYLFNIDGLNYQASQLPTGVVFDSKKTPQKVSVKFTVNTTYACKPQPINLLELK